MTRSCSRRWARTARPWCAYRATRPRSAAHSTCRPSSRRCGGARSARRARRPSRCRACSLRARCTRALRSAAATATRAAPRSSSSTTSPAGCKARGTRRRARRTKARAACATIRTIRSAGSASGCSASPSSAGSSSASARRPRRGATTSSCGRASTRRPPWTAARPTTAGRTRRACRGCSRRRRARASCQNHERASDVGSVATTEDGGPFLLTLPFVANSLARSRGQPQPHPSYPPPASCRPPSTRSGQPCTTSPTRAPWGVIRARELC
mmetsp:Transcript_37718/g.95776  ORF Transcript_37718/g.95776 Transcript_37718/m.95776 type:complete len:269 (-) Transcript_37718:37-843(-)